MKLPSQVLSINWKVHYVYINENYFNNVIYCTDVGRLWL
ncbi:hypothetical protein VCHA28O22_20398 [Vibrio chagasii]|nr:hypothetical protein VCHA28O22_20398 [Vibrio chagasii]CAH6941586.1 hypothetical protein VCHA50O393_120082 [Vibrio chagasii]CAH7296872.1 hypothetical protein VCHA53O474_20394 [Vibrio chagasii]